MKEVAGNFYRNVDPETGEIRQGWAAMVADHSDAVEGEQEVSIMPAERAPQFLQRMEEGRGVQSDQPDEDWSRPTDWELTIELAQEFPARYVQKAPQGSRTDIDHCRYHPAALAVHGPYSFEVKDVIRGTPLRSSARTRPSQLGRVRYSG